MKGVSCEGTQHAHGIMMEQRAKRACGVPQLHCELVGLWRVWGRFVPSCCACSHSRSTQERMVEQRHGVPARDGGHASVGSLLSS